MNKRDLEVINEEISDDEKPKYKKKKGESAILAFQHWVYYNTLSDPSFTLGSFVFSSTQLHWPP